MTVCTQTNLIGPIKQIFATLPDARSGGDGMYQKQALSDAALSAFSVFFMPSPLVPEFIKPQEGSEKQDYELAASNRWLEKVNDFPENTALL